MAYLITLLSKPCAMCFYMQLAYIVNALPDELTLSLAKPAVLQTTGVHVQLLHRAAMAIFVLSIGTVTFGAAFRYSVPLAQYYQTVARSAFINCSVHLQPVISNLLYYTMCGLVLILTAYTNR
jgi:hypothetical protein